MMSLGSGEAVKLFEGRPVSETPGAKASGESEVLRDPSVGSLRRGGDTS
jgi:hypothetical protein